MNRRERRAAAQQLKASATGADSAAALYQAGMGHLRAGRLLEVQLACRQALALDADHADTLHLMGLLSLGSQQYDHAVEWIARAIRQEAKPEFLASLGSALHAQGRLDEALQAYDKAVQLRPEAAALWKQLGFVLAGLNRPDEAVLSYQHALKLDPRDPEAPRKVGALLFNLGRPEEALHYAELSNQLRADQAPTLQLRALALFGLGRSQDALADMLRAHALDPADADSCSHAGRFLQRLGRDAEALSWFDRALALRPDDLAVLFSKAHSLTDLHRFAEAFTVYDRMKTIDPGNTEAEWALALLHLLMGNFPAGWAGREVRWKIPHSPISRPDVPKPIWLGKEPLDGKTILFHMDEGLGDTIQYVRYLPMVAAQGAIVLLLVPDILCPLLDGLGGVCRCLPLSIGTLPPFHTYCPMSSLPLIFGTTIATIPPGSGYLPRPAAQRVAAWERRLGAHDRLRVGLAWSGNPKHSNDRNRSLPLQRLALLLQLDASFVSLQKDVRPTDRAQLGPSGIVDLTADLTDFAETAALVSCLDLVISVDTSIAHLAAALGGPTWILLPYTPDYRWLLDRDDSPWYPAARLFRQGPARDYSEVIERVRTELGKLISARRTARQP